MRLPILLTVATLAAVFAGCATIPTPPARSAEPGHGTPSTVILISIDGYRADYLARGDSPVLQRLASEGVRARWMIPAFPTVTEPNHYTLLTGLYPDHNGIVANTIDDGHVQHDWFEMGRYARTANPRWWSKATPLWVSVQQEGMRAAEASWPGGYVRLDGMRPDLRGAHEQVRTPGTETALVEHWLELPATRRPRLILLHYEPVDAAGHRYGPDSPQEDAALREVDNALGKLVDALKRDGLYSSTDLVVVSDHGMAEVSAARRIYLDDLIDLHAVTAVTLGAGATLNPHDTAAGAAAEATLLAPHPHLHCWHKHDLPAHLHYGRNPRIPAIVCLATPGWLVTTHAREEDRAYPLRGTHGYDNLAPAMRALFVAEGPSFRRGYLAAPFPNVDVYPLLAHILNVTPERNDGNLAQVESFLAPTAR